jgi:ubiquitin carboxyl-terminal hydrolase 25/28
MVGSQSKYVDPSLVLSTLVDDFGNRVIIGEQQDVGEFNINFIARAEEGMLAARHVEEAKSAEPHLVESIKLEGSFTRSATLNTMQQLLQSEDSFVARLFYGKQVEVLRASEADSSLVEQRNEVAFGQIELNVDANELYAAWDESFFCTINDYTTSLGHKTEATQEVWLQRLPSVLLFQICRVKYDLKSEQSVKDHSAFTFPIILYPDRYMESKASLSAGLRAQVYKLKENVSQLTSKIDEFERYNGGQTSLHRMLNTSARFLRKQGENQPAPIDPACPLFDVDCLEELSSDDIDNLNHAMLVIKRFAASARSKLKTMQTQLKILREQIEAKFDIEELKQCPYYLHAILVHEGQAGSGHYFAFIHDALEQKWRKYNDIRVTEVDEQEVFKVAEGGFGSNSAYCLVYVDKKTHGSLDNASLLESYAQIFPDAVRRDLEDDNARLSRELVDWRLGSLMKQMQDIYTSRSVQVQAQFSAFLSQQTSRTDMTKYELVNFTLYLKTRNNDYLSKWHLLDISVSEVNSLSLSQMSPQDPFYIKIKNQFHSACREAPERLELYQAEKASLEKLLVEYLTSLRDASIACYLLKKMLEGAMVEAITVTTMYLNSPVEVHTTYRRTIVDSSKVLALFLTSQVILNFYSGKADDVRTTQALLIARHTATLVALNFEMTDPHYSQCIINLNGAIEWARANFDRSKLSQAIYDEFTALIAEFRTGSAIPSIELDSPADYTQLVNSIDRTYAYGWIEGWKTECISHQFVVQLNDFKSSAYRPWLELHTKITNMRTSLPLAEIRSYEAKGGIKP